MEWERRQVTSTKVAWRSISTEFGVPYVMTTGVWLMEMSCAGIYILYSTFSYYVYMKVYGEVLL